MPLYRGSYDDYGGAYDHVVPPAKWRKTDHMGQPREGKAVPAGTVCCVPAGTAYSIRETVLFQLRLN